MKNQRNANKITGNNLLKSENVESTPIRIDRISTTIELRDQNKTDRYFNGTKSVCVCVNT